jgi:hypothetical protein
MPSKYTLIPAKTPVIQWTPLWHIVVVSVAAGCGLAVAFGLILLGIQWSEKRKSGAEKGGGYLLSGLAAAFCLAAIAAGIYAMAHPAKTKPLKVVPKSALVVAGNRTPA